MKRFILVSLAVALCACTNQIVTEDHGDWTLVKQTKGPELGYSNTSGLQLLEVDGYAFKDLNRNGELDVYEDWRQSVYDRAADLASSTTTRRRNTSAWT